MTTKTYRGYPVRVVTYGGTTCYDCPALPGSEPRALAPNWSTLRKWIDAAIAAGELPRAPLPDHWRLVERPEPFEFDTYARLRQQDRALRRAQLETALARGLVVWQRDVLWSTAGVIHTRGGDVRASATFIEPHQSDPAYLAEHLENREHGFGYLTTIVTTKGVK